MEPDLVVKQQPRNVAVLHDGELLQQLREQPVKLDANEIELLARAARKEGTWR